MWRMRSGIDGRLMVIAGTNIRESQTPTEDGGKLVDGGPSLDLYTVRTSHLIGLIRTRMNPHH